MHYRLRYLFASYYLNLNSDYLLFKCDYTFRTEYTLILGPDIAAIVRNHF